MTKNRIDISLELDEFGIRGVIIGADSLEEEVDAVFFLSRCAPEIEALRKKIQKPVAPRAQDLLWIKEFLESMENQNSAVGALAGRSENPRTFEKINPVDSERCEN